MQLSEMEGVAPFIPLHPLPKVSLRLGFCSGSSWTVPGDAEPPCPGRRWFLWQGPCPFCPSGRFAPPYMLDDADELNLESSHAEGWQCSLEESRQSFAQQLQDAARATKMLWLVATRYYAPKRWEAYGALFETMAQLECFAAFRGCYPQGTRQEAATVLPVCLAFREEAERVFALDAYLGDAAGQLGKELIISQEALIQLKHPCYETDDLSNFQAHDILRRQALMPASNLFGTYVGELFAGDSLQQHPHLTAFWIPRWVAPDLHTFGLCRRPHLLKWYASFEPPRIPNNVPSEWRDSWLVNLGAGDGSCDQDIPRQDNLERSFLGSNDVANCLLRDGFGGFLFEGDDRHEALLRNLTLGRSDLELHLGFIDPETVASILRRALAERQSSPQLLKVDVDNCDCCFLETILETGLKPLLIHVEVSPLVPPPFVYRPVAFDGTIFDSMEALNASEGRRGHMRHCSLSAFVELLEPLGYQLVYFNYHDATFAQDVVEAPGWLQGRSPLEVWYGLFFCHPMRWVDPLEILYKEKFLYDYR
ncbi:unnamed protein product [Durusdinium trenchii]|uniref:Methyltransferase domain-containing protein n=1 Tax=Durusdinium trenchii TaxID=1381693 RepID=A0ABP0IIE1_9DINO